MSGGERQHISIRKFRFSLGSFARLCLADAEWTAIDINVDIRGRRCDRCGFSAANSPAVRKLG